MLNPRPLLVLMTAALLVLATAAWITSTAIASTDAAPVAVEAPIDVAPVAPAAVTPDDPVGAAGELLALLKSGQYLPAVGVALVLLVAGMRWGGSKLHPWFKSQAGGYVLGYGAALLLYVGTALNAGAGVSIGLFGSALAAGWVASGGWESFRDFAGWLRSKT